MNKDDIERQKSPRYESIRPFALTCAICMLGGGLPRDDPDIKICTDAILHDQNCALTLETAYDHAGARTEKYALIPPNERKRDLDILQRLGAVPGMQRTVRTWLWIIKKTIPDIKDICQKGMSGLPGWEICQNAATGVYDRGLCLTESIKRDPLESAAAKEESVNSIKKAGNIKIRAHHLLCMICHAGGEHSGEVLSEDNLQEVWDRMIEAPGLMITLVDGPGECVICPPCPGYDPDPGMCDLICSLKDRKKDMEVFCRLGLLPGDTLGASEIMHKIFDNISSVEGICKFSEETAHEWACCRTHVNDAYSKGVIEGKKRILKKSGDRP